MANRTVRVGIGGIVHETNTYANDTFGLTGLGDFHVQGPEDIAKRHRGVRTCIGGMLDAAEDLSFDAVPLYWANAQPSGTIERAAYDHMKGRLIEELKAAGDLDAIALDLHGAGVVDGLEDLEGDLLADVRGLVGDAVPIVVTLDLHGNISDESARLADVLLGYHLYPHTDLWERGDEAVRLLPDLLDGTLRPTAHVEHLPVLLPTSTTDAGHPAHDMNEVCAAIEAWEGVVDCTVFHGFPYTDIANVGVHVVVTTNGDEALARRAGAEVGRWIWEHREEFRVEHASAEQAVRMAADADEYPVVINETSDNPGGGAPGDGTHLLRAMLDADLPDSAFGYLYDPAVAKQAHEAGVGATISIHLGGKHDDLHGAPIDADAYVKCLTDGRMILQAMAAGSRFNLGPMARLVIGNVDVIVGSRRSQTFDPGLFTLHGIDVTRYKVIALKSSNHFRAGFRDLAARIVTADTPGLTTYRVQGFPRIATTTPLWPKDAAAEYAPTA